MKLLPDGCVSDCIGCHHRMMSATESLQQKYAYLSRVLAPWHAVLHEVQSLPEELRMAYREKVSLTANYIHDTWRFGLMRRDEFIAIPRCPIHAPIVNKSLEIFSNILPHYQQFPLAYYVQSDRQVVLVCKNNDRPATDWFTIEVWQQLTDVGIEGLWLHCNLSAGRRMFRKGGWHLLAGKEKSCSRQGLLYGPMAFAQVLSALHEESLQLSEKFFALHADDYIIDFYCGIGSSMKRWATHTENILG